MPPTPKNSTKILAMMRMVRYINVSQVWVRAVAAVVCFKLLMQRAEHLDNLPLRLFRTSKPALERRGNGAIKRWRHKPGWQVDGSELLNTVPRVFTGKKCAIWRCKDFDAAYAARVPAPLWRGQR
jgi:hypothetical protein